MTEAKKPKEPYQTVLNLDADEVETLILALCERNVKRIHMGNTPFPGDLEFMEAHDGYHADSLSGTVESWRDLASVLLEYAGETQSTATTRVHDIGAPIHYQLARRRCDIGETALNLADRVAATVSTAHGLPYHALDSFLHPDNYSA